MKEHPINVTENEIKMVIEGFMSDLQKLNEPAKPAKGCRWVEWKDKRTGLMVGEYR